MVGAVLVPGLGAVVDLVLCQGDVWICVFIWVRGTLPRLRQDQLMNFAWKFVLPMSLLNLVVAALWRFMGEGWLRWVVCSAILVLAYVVMGTWGCEGSISARGVIGMRSKDWVRFALSHSCAKYAHEWGTQIPGLRIETWGAQILPGPQGRGAGSTQFGESPSDFVRLGERSGWLWELSSI